ncbi:MAG: C1 family peptidase [Paludibacteraceae bacterium]|nr:C1 family peptidase [Paludibacteraceae bacterium]
MSNSQREYMMIPTINLQRLSLISLSNTIAYNCEDSILELVTPPVGNQGSQNSCTAWACAYTAASIVTYSLVQDWNIALRSPAFLFHIYQNHEINANCDSIIFPRIAFYLHSYGVCSYSLMPYDEDDCSSAPNSIQTADAIANKYQYNKLNSETNVNEYKQILRLGYPIVVSTQYVNSFNNMWNNNNGIWTSLSDTTHTDIEHVTCIIGYDDHQQMFKVMNSWGTDGGDNGFYWVSYNLVAAGCFTHAIIFELETNQLYGRIDGPDEICDDTISYTIHNVPEDANITWSYERNAPINIVPYDPVMIIGPHSDSTMHITRDFIPVFKNTTQESSPARTLTTFSAPTDSVILIKVNLNVPYTNSVTFIKEVKLPVRYQPHISPNYSRYYVRTQYTFEEDNINDTYINYVKWEITPMAINPPTTINLGTGRSKNYTPSIIGPHTIKLTNNYGCEGNNTFTYSFFALPRLIASYNNPVRTDIVNITLNEDILETSVNNTFITSNEQNYSVLDFCNNDYQVELWSEQFGCVRKMDIHSTDIQLNVGELPNGIYHLIIKYKNDILNQSKMMIMNK